MGGRYVFIIIVVVVVNIILVRMIILLSSSYFYSVPFRSVPFIGTGVVQINTLGGGSTKYPPQMKQTRRNAIMNDVKSAAREGVKLLRANNLIFNPKKEYSKFLKPPSDHPNKQLVYILMHQDDCNCNGKVRSSVDMLNYSVRTHTSFLPSHLLFFLTIKHKNTDTTRRDNTMTGRQTTTTTSYNNQMIFTHNNNNRNDTSSRVLCVLVAG